MSDCGVRFQRETHEVWLVAKQRVLLGPDLRSVHLMDTAVHTTDGECRLPRGEKSKSKRAKESGEEMKEVTLNNLEILRRKLSAGLGRKV